MSRSRTLSPPILKRLMTQNDRDVSKPPRGERSIGHPGNYPTTRVDRLSFFPTPLCLSARIVTRNGRAGSDCTKVLVRTKISSGQQETFLIFGLAKWRRVFEPLLRFMEYGFQP
ncbi:hypothetical protein L596_029289 [Steinernema carpocapsae]|uniref:Uncharacterized protein n=1 Tax=Steinernema carpocapsae TaxID=34508 RepID=A0A4U5LU76_STECR|nr:hypothetical protein L596_029289 [Steinernema carpocapsae]